MTENFVYPTHTCFDDSLDLMIEMLKADLDLLPYLRLVHGTCQLPDGKLYAHAWLENVATGEAYFTGIVDGERHHFRGNAREYRAEARCRDFIRYNYLKAKALNQLSKHYGPWATHLVDLQKAAGQSR